MTKKIVLGDPIIINGRKLSLSRAVKAGDYIFCTGQVPMKEGLVMTSGSIEDQTRIVIEEIKKTLELGNCSLDDVVKSDKAFKSSSELKTPILIDHTGKVGKAYGARSTPHMFVIDKEGVLQYQGAFSDQGKTNYVLNAVEAIKAGKTPSPATTKSWGCGIKYASGSASGRGGKGGKRRRN